MGMKRIIALGGGIIALVVAAGIILRSECREKMMLKNCWERYC